MYTYIEHTGGGGGGGGGGEGGGRGGGGGEEEEEEEEDLEGRGCAAPFLSCNGRVCVRHSSLLRISSRYTLQTRAHLPLPPVSCFFPFFFPFFPSLYYFLLPFVSLLPSIRFCLCLTCQVQFHIILKNRKNLKRGLQAKCSPLSSLLVHSFDH